MCLVDNVVKYVTTLVPANSNKEVTLRSALPIDLVRLFGLKRGDMLVWQVEGVEEKRVIVVFKKLEDL